jgi:molybdopterin converting factor subunit 1
VKVDIKVRFFAVLRDLSGRSEETLTVQHGAQAGEIYLQLAAKYAFPLALSDVRVAVNDEFTHHTHPLQSGDLLVFIPPVAGG